MSRNPLGANGIALLPRSDGQHPNQVRTHFKPGHKLQPKDSTSKRRKVTSIFLTDLIADYQAINPATGKQQGVEAIAMLRVLDPVNYCKIIAMLLPKEIEVRKPLEDIDDDELAVLVDGLRSAMAASAAREGATDAEIVPPAE